MSGHYFHRCMLLEVRGLSRSYRLPRQHLLAPRPELRALRDVSFSIAPGQSLGIVGESGSGKSTLARLVMALDRPSGGSVRLLGRDLFAMTPQQLRIARTDFQMVFQDPYGSLDPRQRVGRIITEPLRALRTHDAAAMSQRAAQVLEQVGMRAADLEKFPHEFSGGQRQRIAIARALITRPRLIVADEPVSALDVSIQAQVLDLMQDLQKTFGISFLLISHDLAVVNHLCDELLVLHQGQVVEKGSPEQIFQQPRHAYTQALIAAIPRVGQGRRRTRLQGADGDGAGAPPVP
ncbi:ABC transporter ATP-binding protein [Corticibacter populi]|uniref:ABC transporter ATP-binding protein n=1 Tax=Corticibacter populi TaxID=1550736 RepID=A0A3M6QRH6_9BURK|nr:ATP-binding cassette domain-containing protein [Corticibacter populi]RMX05655.1 ABC transporter ATP-binding protein [Corticibacter populi]RZS31065.1 peptide/nickel transport system ATP-binding protein [Corticibacter populi]